MVNFYIGLLLSLFCVFLSCVLLSRILLVALFCVALTCVCFKDDFTLFRYVATSVLSLYVWFCEYCSNTQTMFNQSNNTNLHVKKCIENNGSVSMKLNKSHYAPKQNVSYSLNLSSNYNLSRPNSDALNIPRAKETWDSCPDIYSSSSCYNKSQFTLSDMSNMDIRTSLNRLQEEKTNKSANSSLYRTSLMSVLTKGDLMPENSRERSSDRQLRTISPDFTTSEAGSFFSSNYTSTGSTPRNDEGSLLDAKLFANVNSPGFCGRVAERISEDMSLQSKYDSVGAFPVVHLRSQSPKTKIKTPVRVRLAPPTSNDLLYTSVGSNSIPRPSLIGTDESMKSVLQVLKEISRKRIHSHIDDDCDENSKRVRISESQYGSDNSMLQSSLLQHTVQGKRAREDSSPTEEDVKKRRKPLQNNEILSSLSSSKLVKPPHLRSQKRKAQVIDDAISSTPVLGKLLKVQTDVTPPSVAAPMPVEEFNISRSTPVPSSCSSESPTLSAEALPASGITKEVSKASESDDDDSTVSRLLGRMSSQAQPVLDKDSSFKKNVFMSTNDLSLSPPKENRLAAMIAVLGGPDENIDFNTLEPDNSEQSREQRKGRALFTSLSSPNTPKNNKKVTFNDSLTTTKIYDVDKSDIENPAHPNGSTSVPQTTSLSPVQADTPAVTMFNFMNKNRNTPNSGSSKIESTSISSASIINFQQKEVPKSAEIDSILGSRSNALSDSVQSKPALSSETAPLSSTASVGSPFSTTTKATMGTVNECAKPSQFSFETQISSSSAPDENTSKLQFTFQPAQTSSANGLKPSSPTMSTFMASNKNLNTFNKDPNSQTTVGHNKTNFMMPTNNTSNESEEEKKLKVNGLVSTTSPSFYFNTSFTQASVKKTDNAFTAFSVSTTSSSQQTAPIFSFGAPSMFPASSASVASTIHTQSISTLSASSGTNTSTSQSYSPSGMISQQITQPVNISSNASSNTTQTGIQVPSPTSAFGTGDSKLGAFQMSGTTKNSLFGTAAFGSSVTSGQVGSATQTTNATQSNTFGSFVPNSNPKPNIFGAASSQPTQGFGLSTTSTSSLVNFSSTFGTASSQNLFSSQAPTTQLISTNSNSSTPNSSTFSNSATTLGQSPAFTSSLMEQPTKPSFIPSLSNTLPTFGSTNTNRSSAFGNQNTLNYGSASSTPSAFGNTNTTFGSSTTSTSTVFGNQNTLSNFGSNNNSSSAFGGPTTGTFAFGNKTNAITGGFGVQNNTTSFGSQNGNNNNNAITTQNSFASPGGFIGNTVLLNANEVKPTSSPFVFGSSQANSEPSKPFAPAAPFSFGPQQSNTSVASPSLPTFNPPSVGFGATTQQVPTFNPGIGATQPATTVFAFGQAAMPAPAFQFNATGSQPAPGSGMFSIGSGSTGPKVKTGTLRRRQRP